MTRLENNTLTQYVYDGGECAQERDSVGSLTKTFIRGSGLGGGIGSILYSEKPSQPREYFLYNVIGSVVVTCGPTGNEVSTSLYEAFGKVIASTGSSDNNRLFCTKERSESIGLDNFGFRYFDWDIGRFIQRDPSGYPDGLNNYLYCSNNPINRIDPLGLKAFYEKNKKDKTITIKAFYNYKSKDYSKKELKKIAKQHEKILEDHFKNANEGKGYTYKDEEGNEWKLKFDAIISTSEESRLEKLQDNLKDANVYSKIYDDVNVHAKPLKDKKTGEDVYNWGDVPGTQAALGTGQLKGYSLEKTLLHELVGHHVLGADDESRRDYISEKGLPERDSMMAYTKQDSKFYQRHFESGFQKKSTITGERRIYGDLHEVNPKDSFFEYCKKDAINIIGEEMRRNQNEKSK